MKKRNIEAHINATAANSSLVVLGAHHFGQRTGPRNEENDDVFVVQLAKKLVWRRILLVEASPLVAAELQRSLVENPDAYATPPERIVVRNVGICAEARRQPGRRQLGRRRHRGARRRGRGGADG